MANLPVDNTVFAVFEMQELSAYSLDPALAAAGGAVGGPPVPNSPAIEKN